MECNNANGLVFELIEINNGAGSNYTPIAIPPKSFTSSGNAQKKVISE